ncbi:phage terminase large subunit family protein [Acetobacter fallax]|uniref:Terminase large subunit gp17-like C-terminal domain-containing protein n=2 Tax=Acetobacter fallax TaxID=1737473 RepID=A0ABX0KE14_9PROT|nr:hypothetical protein [Acetobacter fallax]NHO34265.1 hypothetical protein [Acetobacter fallax]NHO37814.1 hypothetical protein [Acetobacter fallax]
MAREISRKYSIKKKLFSGATENSCDHITIYPDPSGRANKTSSCGRTDISILKSFGFKINVMKKAPPVRDRLNVTNAMFENSAGERHAYVSPRCRSSIESYERYIYCGGTSEPDKNGGFDHLVDATGYYFFFRFSKAGAAVATQDFFER